MPSPLERAVSRFRSRPRAPAGARADVRDDVSAAAFRAATEQRLRGVERDLAEIKSRVNGLIFLVAGAVITQILLNLVQ